jgi:hypothetical protein
VRAWRSGRQSRRPQSLVGNRTTEQLAPGLTIYERLMDAFDPVLPGGERNSFIFRTHQSSDRKHVAGGQLSLGYLAWHTALTSHGFGEFAAEDRSQGGSFGVSITKKF